MRIAVIVALALVAGWLTWSHFDHPIPVAATTTASTNIASSVPAVYARPPIAHRRPNPQAHPKAEKPTLAQFLSQLQNGEMPQLRPEQLDLYLQQNQRNAGSLLAAFRTTGDKEFLKEALEKYPHNPLVNYAAAFRSDTPEERAHHLAELKQAAPDNALPNYLAAYDLFKSGHPDDAAQELLAASGKSGWQDYSPAFIQNAEEAYRAAGYSQTEAKLLADAGLVLPQMQELRDLGRKMNELAKSYQQNNDAVSAQATRDLALSLGLRMEEPSAGVSMLNNLVGIAIQREILGSLDPASPYGNTGHTVSEELAALTQRKADLRELNIQVDAILPTLSETDAIHYFDREKSFGSIEAMKWLVNRQPKP